MGAPATTYAPRPTGLWSGLSSAVAPRGHLWPYAFGNALGSGLVDQMAEGGVPLPASADEKRQILELFADGPTSSIAGGSGLKLGAPANGTVRFSDASVAQWGAETTQRIKDGARAWANWDRAYNEYTAKQDAEAEARYRAWLPQQHRQADAYRRELAEAAQRAKWDAMQVGAWGGRTNQVLPAASSAPVVTGTISADPGYITNLRNILTSDGSVGDKLSMAWGMTRYAFRGSDTAQGTLQIVGGGIEVVGAVGLTTTGLGTALALPLALHGGDNIGTGISRISGVGDGSTVTYQGVYALSGSVGLANTVDHGIPFLSGFASIGQGLRLAENQVFNNTVYRGLTPRDAAALDDGLGLTAKNPSGVWTAEDHVANFKFGTMGGALKNDPWIGTTRNYEVVVGPNGYDSGNGIVAINLNRVPNAQVEVWQGEARSNIFKISEPYHRSIWAEEVCVYQSVPARAIYTPFAPINQVPVYGPIAYGLTLGGSGFTNNPGGSQ